MTRHFRLPREHGAYGQLGVPLVAALASGRPGVAAIAFALGAVAVFLLHEPLLLFARRRGGRALATARSARRLERSLYGELVIASALAGAAVPVALASGVDTSVAIWTWAAWSIGFGAVTCVMHGSVLRSPHRNARVARGLGVALVIAALALVVARPSPAAAALPLVITAVALHAMKPSPRQLRQVGWALMTATLTVGAWMVIGIRFA